MKQGIFGVGENDFETTDTDFDFFSKPTFNNDFYNFNDYTYKPKNPIQSTEHNPVIFEIGNDESRLYTLLQTLRIDGQIKVSHTDGTPLGASEKISVTNLMPHALFQSVDIKINSQPVSDHARLYPHRAYVHALYSFSKEVKDVNLLGEFYLEDDSSSEVVDDSSAGFTGRTELIKGSRLCYISFEPKIDSLSINRFFPPGHTISFEFIRAPSNFTLLTKDGSKQYKIDILDLSLCVRQVLPNSNIESKLHKMLSIKDVHLPVTRLVSRTRSLHAGLFDGTVSNAISGRAPSHMMIFFLKNSQISGDLSVNPFYFGHHDLAEASLVINGQSFPSEKLTFDLPAGDYFRSYHHFLKNIGCSGDVSNGITPQRYMKNCFSLAFDLTPDTCLNNHLHSSHDVNIDIKLRFKTALPYPITILYISTYDNIITLSPDKTVSLDYSV